MMSDLQQKKNQVIGIEIEIRGVKATGMPPFHPFDRHMALRKTFKPGKEEKSHLPWSYEIRNAQALRIG
jgi:hypothetical protein